MKAIKLKFDPTEQLRCSRLHCTSECADKDASLMKDIGATDVVIIENRGLTWTARGMMTLRQIARFASAEAHREGQSMKTSRGEGI